MRRLVPALLLSALPLAAQSAMVSLIRQPRATLLEFTTPITELEAAKPGHDLGRFHLGVGLGVRHWDDGDTAVRFVADANASARRFFIGLGAVVEAPSGEGLWLGPRLRVGRVLSPTWVLSVEAEHLEHPFSPGLSVSRRSALGLVLTARF